MSSHRELSSLATTSRISLVDCDLSSNPVCSHGPTLLFEIKDIDENKKFYSCSSCRNRKDCDFYMPFEQWVNYDQSGGQKKSGSIVRPTLNSDYIYYKKLKSAENGLKFCRNCSLIISSGDELSKHKKHEIIDGLTKRQLRCPTRLMDSLTDNKFCAQYLFSTKTKKFIIDEIIKKNGFTRVVCVGCPSVHEYISCRQNRLNLKSILLDIDDRYKQFYSPKQYLKFNLFNNHFFDGFKSQKTFEKFVKESPKDSIILVIDPPFGGLIEAMANTIEKMSLMSRNKIDADCQSLPIVLFFPYFNEHRIKSQMPFLRISDYMVDYENHQKFHSNQSGRKFGSPVRIYTNIKLSSIVLPEADGYYYCDYCLKYVSKNNKHCFECNDCTARDGKPYNHCYECRKCVKQTWNHCQTCSYCHLIDQSFDCKRKSDYYITQNKRNRK